MKKVFAVVVLISTLSLVGCTNPGLGEEQTDSRLSEAQIVLSDGRTVTCIIRTSGYKGGLSCDWVGARND